MFIEIVLVYSGNQMQVANIFHLMKCTVL